MEMTMHHTAPVKIFVIDDQLIARQGLRVLLADAEGVTIIGDAASGEAGIALCKTVQPDVIVIEILLRNEDGVEVIRRLRDICPNSAVLVMSYDISIVLVQAAMRAGVLGYLLKDATATDVLRAIELIRRGQLALAPQIAQILVQTNTQHTRTLALTDREYEVLTLLAQGLNNNTIADKLSISPYTVKNHVSNILGKLGASTRTQAISFAMQEGLITSDHQARLGGGKLGQYGSI
jgi:two-component system, NarL family, response regulator LiaR